MGKSCDVKIGLFFKMKPSIYIHILCCSPCDSLLRPILCRHHRRQDLFVVAMLKYWAETDDDKLAESLMGYLTKSHTTPNRKRKG